MYVIALNITRALSLNKIQKQLLYCRFSYIAVFFHWYTSRKYYFHFPWLKNVHAVIYQQLFEPWNINQLCDATINVISQSRHSKWCIRQSSARKQPRYALPSVSWLLAWHPSHVAWDPSVVWARSCDPELGHVEHVEWYPDLEWNLDFWCWLCLLFEFIGISYGF